MSRFKTFWKDRGGAVKVLLLLFRKLNLPGKTPDSNRIKQARAAERNERCCMYEHCMYEHAGQDLSFCNFPSGGHQAFLSLFLKQFQSTGIHTNAVLHAAEELHGIGRIID